MFRKKKVKGPEQSYQEFYNKHSNFYYSSAPKHSATNYANYYNNCPVQENLVLYEAFFGRGILCNVHGLFASFLEREDFKDYEHVWAIEDFEMNQELIKEYKKYKNVRFIEYLSDEYYKTLASAKYLVNNVTFPAVFTKKEEQVYINTWHGIPLKTLGYDQVEGNNTVANTIRNLIATDYLISPCDYQTDIYKNAFKLDGIFTGKILVEGQPRNDLSVTYDRETILERMRRNGISVDSNKKIVLYAPTWKGANYGAPTLDIDAYFDFIRIMEEHLDTNEYQVLVKPHQVVYQHLKGDSRMTGQFVPASLDANEVLAVTDILVSDYSSIYFDYLVTNRPILFYIPDIDDYKEYRGLYMTVDELPGPATENMEEVVGWIQNISDIQSQYKAKYEEAKNKFIPYDDGQSGKRVLDCVLDGKASERVINGLVTKKKKILAYVGKTRINGITESFNSLLDQMDFDKFDVTVYVMQTDDKREIENMCKINPKARVIRKVGQPNATLEESACNEMMLFYGLDNPETQKYYKKSFYQKEYRRQLGYAAFDYVVNFTGYSSYYALLLMEAPNTKKLMWLHNDLEKDRNRLVNGKKPLYEELGTVFSTYPYYDKLVSCSESVMEVNRKALSTPETYSKFTYCHNLCNFNRVFAGRDNDPIISIEDKDYCVTSMTGDESSMASVSACEKPEEGTITFATMGRMSPEKNHANLIKAFAKFNKETPNSKLFILGDGPLMNSLKELVHEVGCDDSVVLVGNVVNPFALLKHCSCFILPSNYEGQPMVLLEARALGMPIIVADFSTVKDSLIEDGQLLIKQDVKSIYDGMKCFADHKVPKKKFDFNNYNEECYRQFESLFD